MADRTNDERLRELTLIAARERYRVEEIKRLRAERDALRAEVEQLREQVRCRACDGAIGDHLAPDQGGCPGRFVIDGVEMAPAAHRSSSDG